MLPAGLRESGLKPQPDGLKMPTSTPVGPLTSTRPSGMTCCCGYRFSHCRPTVSIVPRFVGSAFGVKTSTSSLMFPEPSRSRPLVMSTRPSGRVVVVGYQRPSRIRPWNIQVSVQGSKV